jgi:hypothetical protein
MIGRRQAGAFVLNLTVALSVLCGIALASSAPANADCVYADVWITSSGGGETNITPWGRRYCVAPTPWPSLTDVTAGDEESWVPTGLPNGLQLRAGATSP